jgi:hypothetical protein
MTRPSIGPDYRWRTTLGETVATTVGVGFIALLFVLLLLFFLHPIY